MKQARHPALSVLTKGLRLCYAIILAALLLGYGSVEPAPLHFLATIAFFVTALALAVERIGVDTRLPFWLAAGLALLLSCWIIIQAWDIGSSTLANSIWVTASRHFGPTVQAISVAPADTLQGLVAVTLPFSIFLSGLVLFPNDEKALLLLRYLAALGAAVALVGLIQYLFFPDMLLFEKRKVSQQNLTAVFVNRNTAATFLGMAAMLAAGFAFGHAQNAGLVSFIRRCIGSRNSTTTRDALMIGLYGLAFIVAITALLLTRSRAGAAASMIGLVVVLALLTYHGGYRARSMQGRGFASAASSIRWRILRSSIVVLGTVAIGLVFSGRVLLRAEVQGAEDARFCIMPGLLRLAGDNWLTGTGLGTFRMVFPAYRDPSCGLAGTWERAHDFYLDGWIALGLPFFLVAAIAIIGLLWAFVRGVRNRRQYRWIAAVGLGILLLQLLHNAVDFSIQIPAVAAFFAATMAACVVVSTRKQASRRRSPSRTPIDPETAVTEAKK